MTEPTPHKWAVTGQEEHPTMDKDGRPTTDHHVQFVTKSGHKSSITLPDDSFTAENVHDAIDYKANEIEKVHALNASVKPEPPAEPAQ